MSGENNVAKWLEDQLSTVLSFPVPQDMIEYIMKIENARDIDDYLKTLLDLTNPTHKQLCESFKVMRCVDIDGKKSKNNTNFVNVSEVVGSLLSKLSLHGEEKPSNDSQKKKKEKYVNLYSPEGESRDTIIFKGRHRCECQAVKHKLVNNCLKCGRIVCAQEGSGPCLFCGSLVCSKEEQEFINARTAQSKKLYENLMEVGGAEEIEKAVSHRDRLLEYDRTSSRRTRVIDDEGEYFSIGSVWLSTPEREKLEKKEMAERERKHASKLHKKFTLDFAGRQIVEDERIELEPIEDDWQTATSEPRAVHPDVNEEWHPMFISSGRITGKKSEGKSQSKVQDKELMEMSDLGVCLSMHQPWASLLVHGIMRHEGRTWYSAHRGRLWIAAAAKQPSEEEIKKTEGFFTLLRMNEQLDFPKHYPTSCLLGCVTVVDCLPQEEYRIRYPGGESQSPFVFICEDPYPLSLKFPISGQHKIYKLDAQTRKAAQQSLLRKMKELAKD